MALFRIRENPVARHAGRWTSPRNRRWIAFGLLVGIAVLTGLLQRYWLEVSVYSGARPELATRWLTLAILSEALLIVPWAAARGTFGWRRLVESGSLDDYRRTRLTTPSIVAGSLWAALAPIGWLVATSGVVSAAAAVLAGADISLGGLIAAHGLLAALGLVAGAAGQAAGGGRRSWLAAPTALLLLGAASTLILALNPFYARMAHPTVWIHWALLPNPITALGAVLGADVLRYPTIYPLTHAHEYFFVYPPAWQTGMLYLLLAAAALAWQTQRVGRSV